MRTQCNGNEQKLDVIALGLVGPAGPAGLMGPAGPQGPTGPAGSTGATGPQGLKGDTGAQGPQGVAGAAGPQGPAGPAGPQGAQGLQGIPGQNGQDSAPGLSKVYNTFDFNNINYAELPVGGTQPAPVLKQLDLPPGKYLVTAKVNVRQKTSNIFAIATCSLSTGSDIFWYGPDLLDDGTSLETHPPGDTSVFTSTIPLTAVLELTQTGKVELRCSRADSAVMDWNFAQLTAILVDEIVHQ